MVQTQKVAKAQELSGNMMQIMLGAQMCSAGFLRGGRFLATKKQLDERTPSTGAYWHWVKLTSDIPAHRLRPKGRTVGSESKRVCLFVRDSPPTIIYIYIYIHYIYIYIYIYMCIHICGSRPFWYSSRTPAKSEYMLVG